MNKLIVSAGLACAAIAAPAHAAPVQWSGNGHYYEFIGNNVTWGQARTAALASTFGSQQGYLVTITSAAENSFLVGLTSASGYALAWTGGTDQGAEGTWVWADGPEANVTFWLGGPGGSSPTYANWNGGEPNDCCAGEDYLHLNWGGPGGWNDHDVGFTNGYIVEYGGLGGGVPEPSAWALLILGFGAVGGALRRGRKTRASLSYA